MVKHEVVHTKFEITFKLQLSNSYRIVQAFMHDYRSKLGILMSSLFQDPRTNVYFCSIMVNIFSMVHLITMSYQ
jgi:hypothetical protein